MNLFFSGGPVPQIEIDPRLSKNIRYRLLSCHGSYIRNAHKTADALQLAGVKHELMFDSGAFTAWSMGREVELDHLLSVYDTMLEKYEPKAEAVWLISLDKIPGSKGRTASPDEIEAAIRVSDENFTILQKRYGDRVLPVFHQNESTRRLHEVAAMAPYICVSPRNDLHESSRRKWSAEVHSLLVPGKRTHGLAATGYAMMSKVPWWSVDSATWVLLAANGHVLYGPTLRVLHISDQSGYLKDADQHYRNIPLSEQMAFKEMVDSRGFDVDKLQSDFYDRMIFNRVVMTEAYEAIPTPEVVAGRQPVEMSLFDL